MYSTATVMCHAITPHTWSPAMNGFTPGSLCIVFLHTTSPKKRR